jgi:hypothetical protein
MNRNGGDEQVEQWRKQGENPFILLLSLQRAIRAKREVPGEYQ